MSDSEKPEFFRHCDKIVEHYESLTKELSDSKAELCEIKKSREDALKQTKFNYEIACSLNAELHKYTEAVRKIHLGLNKIARKAPSEIKTDINRLRDFLCGYNQLDKNGYNNGAPVSKSVDYEPGNIVRRGPVRSSHVSDDESPLEDTAIAPHSTANSSANVEPESDNPSGKGTPRKIKNEMLEKPMDSKSAIGNDSIRQSARDRGWNGISENGEERRKNSGSGNSTTEVNSEDRVDRVCKRRNERKHRLQHMRGREKDPTSMSLPRASVRAAYYDIPRMNNLCYSFPEYGASMYNSMNSTYYDVYNSAMPSCYPVQYLAQHRPTFNGDAALYNGNGASNPITYPAHDSYVDYMNSTTDVRSSQTLAESSEDIRRCTIGPNALKVKATYVHDDVVSSVALGGDYLAATACKGLIKLWDTRRPQADSSLLKIDTQTTGYIRSCKISGDGKNLIVAGECAYISLWDIEGYNSGAVSRSPTKRMEIGDSKDECYSLIVSNDGRVCYAGCSNGNIIVWDLISNKIVKTLKGHSGVVTCMDMPLDSNILYSGSLDCSVMKWDIRDCKMEEKIINHSQVYSIAASTNRRWVTVGLENSIVNIFSIEVAKIELKVHTNSVLGMKMAPNNEWLLSVGKDGMVNAIKMPHGPPVHRTCEEDEILACDMSADVKHVLTGSSGRKSTLYEVLL